MARQIENDKGFLVIQCTVGELMQIEKNENIIENYRVRYFFNRYGDYDYTNVFLV